MQTCRCTIVQVISREKCVPEQFRKIDGQVLFQGQRHRSVYAQPSIYLGDRHLISLTTICIYIVVRITAFYIGIIISAHLNAHRHLWLLWLWPWHVCPRRLVPLVSRDLLNQSHRLINFLLPGFGSDFLSWNQWQKRRIVVIFAALTTQQVPLHVLGLPAPAGAAVPGQAA